MNLWELMLRQVDCQVVNLLLVAFTQNFSPLSFYCNWLHCLISLFLSMHPCMTLALCMHRTRMIFGNVRLVFFVVVFFPPIIFHRYEIPQVCISQHYDNVTSLWSTNRMNSSNFDKLQHLILRQDVNGLGNLYVFLLECVLQFRWRNQVLF